MRPDFPTEAHQAAAALARLLVVAARSGDDRTREIRLPLPFSNMTRAYWRRSILLWRQHGLPLLLDQDPRPCPACGSDEADSLFTSYDGHPYVECRVCRTWYVPLRVDYALYRRFFDLCPEAERFGDYTRTQIEDAAVAASDRQRFEGYYRDLLAMLPAADATTPAALDIGCGVGNSLVVAAELGFAVVGVEVNEEAVSIARRLERPVLFPPELEPDRRFDVVTLWETLEHLHDPLAVLRETAGRMNPGGLVALTVPNLDSPCIRSLRADSVLVHGGPAWAGHINLFTLRSLRGLLARAGFAIVDACGQYSMDLNELAAYHLGLWSGARDHLRRRDPVVHLPVPVVRLLEEISALVAAWEEEFAMGPILRVIARREGDSPPAVDGVGRQRAMAVARRLTEAYGEGTEAASPRPRGRAVPLGEAAYRDAAATLNEAAGLDVRGRTSGPLAYLWRSRPMQLPAGAVVLARGKLYSGGLSIGLLSGDRWAATTTRSLPGSFEISVGPVPAGEYSLVISNQGADELATDLTVDRLEIVS